MGRTLAAFVLLVALLPAPASATILANWSLDDVVAHADLIVVGTVGASRSVKVGRRVLTETDIQVERTLFGLAGPTVVVTQPGGRDGRYVTTVPGVVSLTPGDRLLLVTHLDREGRRWVVGLCLGAFRIAGRELQQTIEVPLVAAGGVVTPAPGERLIHLEAIELAIARRRR